MSEELVPGRWTDGELPPNVMIGTGTLITGGSVFKRFRSRKVPALTIGMNSTMDGAHFALGETGEVEIGNFCYFTNALMLCEAAIRIGNYVVIGWNATLADTDFHPIEPAERIADAIACSPLGAGRPRRDVARRPIIIDDDVWIGPGATILKGVHIGTGAFIEPGALITQDVPPGARMHGNPARIAGHA